MEITLSLTPSACPKSLTSTHHHMSPLYSSSRALSRIPSTITGHGMRFTRQGRCDSPRNSLSGGYNASPGALFLVLTAPTQITNKQCSTTPPSATLHVHMPINGRARDFKKKKAPEGRQLAPRSAPSPCTEARTSRLVSHSLSVTRCNSALTHLTNTLKTSPDS
jgi:hypothetical protein